MSSSKVFKSLIVPATRRIFNRNQNLASIAASSVAIYFILNEGDDRALVSSTFCEAPRFPSTNPVWPSGVSEKDVDALVDDILKDPAINLHNVPDYIERQLYRSTIILTLNTVYESIGQIHGQKFLGHRIHLHRKKIESGAFLKGEGGLRLSAGDIDEAILESMADRLLANKSINQTLIPDAIERQLYVSCIKLVFRILDTLVHSFKLTVCGHDIAMSIEKNEYLKQKIKAADRVVSSLTEIDTKALQRYARNMGVEATRATEMSFFQRILNAPQEELLTRMHATLYALILGIVDDFFANTTINLMNDAIQFDIVVHSEEDEENDDESQKSVISNEASANKGSSSSGIGMVFTAGVGVGIAIGASLLSLLK